MGYAAGMVMQIRIKAALACTLTFLTSAASAEWLRVGENARWVSYVDSNVRDSGRSKIAWVLFDYKTVQESPRSGKRYLSEKAQREIDCQGERGRVLFFTWHANSKGDGAVIYTGDKPMGWEPSNSPQSIGYEISKFVCARK